VQEILILFFKHCSSHNSKYRKIKHCIGHYWSKRLGIQGELVENSSSNTTENLMVGSLSNQQAWKILRIHSCSGNILWNGQAPGSFCWVRCQVSPTEWARWHTHQNGRDHSMALSSRVADSKIIRKFMFNRYILITGRFCHMLWSRKWHDLSAQNLMRDLMLDRGQVWSRVLTCSLLIEWNIKCRYSSLQRYSKQPLAN
jgi:hypothetical protein